MSLTSKINVKKNNKQKLSKFNIIDIKNLINSNKDKQKKYFSNKIERKYYTDLLSIEFINNRLYRQEMDDYININLLIEDYFSFDRLFNFRSGLIALSEYHLSSATLNEKMLYNDSSLETIILAYKYIFQIELNKKTNVFESVEDSLIPEQKIFDQILIKYFNTPTSNYNILNSIFFYRSFPIFNFIIYNKIKNYDFFKKRISESNNFDFYFQTIPNLKDITYLNYLIDDDLEIYIQNVKHLLNNNYNILDYVFYNETFPINHTEYILILELFDDLTIDDQTALFNINIPTIDDLEDDDNDNAYLTIYLYIMIQELRILYGKNDSDVYFNFNKFFNFPVIEYFDQPPDEKIFNNYKNKTLKLDFSTVKHLIYKGFIRLFIEYFTALVILYDNKLESILDLNHGSTNFPIPHIQLFHLSATENKENTTINTIKINKINNMYKKLPNDVYNIFFCDLRNYKRILREYMTTKSAKKFYKNLNLLMVDTNTINIYNYFNLHGDIYKNIYKTIDKFVNTLKYISLIRNSKNYPLLLFFLFSNNKIKFIYEPNNDSFLKSLQNLLYTDLDIYISE